MTQHNWPLNYTAIFDKRSKMLLEIKQNPALKTTLNIIYKNDPVKFIEDWCITYDPRTATKIMPFILFPRQKEFVQFFLECLRDKENALVEKCRDVGATWLCCAISVWMWLYIPESSIGWGSRKEMLVDRLGDPDSIFEKIRLIIRKLPAFLLPVGFNTKDDMPALKIINRIGGAIIKGEAGDNIGRGGRSLVYIKDESAHYERPELIEASLGDNTDVQIDISSVNGTANVFYRRRQSGEVWEPGKVMTKGKTRVFIFDWRDHPGKTTEWYEGRRQKAQDDGLLHIFAQEVDRDYSGSIEGVIIPQKWVNAAIDAHIKLKFEPSGAKLAALDVADEGGDKNAYAMRYGVILQYIDHWGEGDPGETSRKAIGLTQEQGVNELYYDCIGVGASVKSDTNRMEREGVLPRTLKVCPWNAGSSPLNPTKRLIPGDINTPKNEDFFLNLKTQAWWMLRDRFRKTYEVIVQNKSYPYDELISIPSTLERIHEVKAELSQPVFTKNSAGKTLVDKKPDGARSPNLADAVCMVYTPNRKVSILDVL